MSSILRQKGSLYCHKGISVFVLEGNHVAKVINRKIPALYFRTGNGIYGPFETPPLRQSSSTIEVPSLEEIDKGAAASSSSVAEGARQAAFEKNLIRSLKVMTTVYDFMTLPFYAAVQQPWKKLALHNSQKAALVDPEKMIYKTLLPKAPLHHEMDQMGTNTVAKLFAHAVKKHGNKRSLGVREVLSEEEVLDSVTGKVVKKLSLGAYRWKTYREVGETVENMSRGLELLNLKPKEKIAIFAETREEWFITAMAAFRRNLPIVTVFTTLGDDGVAHALQETEVTTIITSEELMPRCKEILKQIPRVKNVVYMDRGNGAKWNNEALSNNASVFKYSDLLSFGARSQTSVHYDEPKPSDVAIIMYTSGSTGVPKGVMLSHGNMIAGLKSSIDVTEGVGQPNPDDAHPAYLPMAHVLELMCEAMTFIQGVKIGYSSPLTLIDNAPGLKEGSKGDASVLRPTVMPAVPLVVERISKGIQQKIAEASPIRRLLFDFFYKYKVGWAKLGYDTPLVNKIFFSKITSLVGGRMRYMIVGGAPLASQTQEFVRTVLCCPVATGYGMTESSAVAALSLNYDLTVGRSGIPISCGCLRLVNWEEGGYRVTDKPFPRGEIYIGGDNVALGYFKRADSTDFFEEDGVRWVKTGDIAEVHPDGVFTIIDRKKDLVKLANGKYVSLGKVEAALKTCPAVDNICVHANPSCSYTVAIMVPTRTTVERIANELRKPVVSFESLCADPVIEDKILAEVQAQGKNMNLQNFEIPKKIHLYPEAWVPQSGLVTAAFKIKRNNVYKQFQNQLNEMYSR